MGSRLRQYATGERGLFTPFHAGGEGAAPSGAGMRDPGFSGRRGPCPLLGDPLLAGDRSAIRGTPAVLGGAKAPGNRAPRTGSEAPAGEREGGGVSPPSGGAAVAVDDSSIVVYSGESPERVSLPSRVRARLPVEADG